MGFLGGTAPKFGDEPDVGVVSTSAPPLRGSVPEWSPEVAAVWGKTSPDDDCLPLWRHLEDSAEVAGLLWDHWVPPAVKRTIALGVPGGEPAARRLVVLLASLHDIGKMTPAFQVKAPGLLGRLLDLGLNCDVTLPETREAPHGALGYVIVRDWLKQMAPAGDGPESRRRSFAASALAAIVGAHHGTLLPQGGNLGKKPHLFGNSGWRAARAELMGVMTQRAGAEADLERWLVEPISPQAQAHLAALVVVADWLASDTSRFPYADRPFDVPAWEDLTLPTPWQPSWGQKSADDLIARRFPKLRNFDPTPIQRGAIEAATTVERPPLILLESDMGSGKTEAGLLAAEVLASRFGLGGVFVALPTMATSDGMFSRVLEWIEHLDVPVAPMFLAHGKAGLNDEYRLLPDDASIEGIHDDAASPATGSPRGHAAVNAWTRGRRKGVLAPFVVGTIDQVLYGALRSKHLSLRHLALAGKVVVIDEVHAADAYMREYLHRILEWLGAFGTPCVLMSATLPVAQRRSLLEAYARGAQSLGCDMSDVVASSPSIEADAYPRVTMLDSSVRSVQVDQAPPRRRRVRLAELDDEPDSLVAVLTESLAAGGCAAVLRNTVDRAQKTWELLRDAFPDTEVVLLHSRFLSIDRARREHDLRSRLGRGASVASGSRPNRLIVVGTQVLEQSLDIDVDVMVTDLAPVDLLLQRIGRLHRHQRGAGEWDRPAALREAVCHVVAGDWHTTPIEPDGGSRRVYGAAALFRSASVLQAHGATVTLPDDIPKLVETAYSPDLTAPPGWESAWNAAEQRAAERVVLARSNAATFLLGNTAISSGLLEKSGYFEPGEPDDGNGGRRQVRDSEDSLEVIVVQRANGELHGMPGSGLPENTVITTDFEPDAWIARRLASSTVRLPAWSTRAYLDDVIAHLELNAFAGWQQSRWLEGQLVLVLDEELRANVGPLTVQYDQNRGLMVSVVKDES